MKYLFKIKRTDVVDYDEYDSAVVCASNTLHAQKIHPASGDVFPTGHWAHDIANTWPVVPTDLKVEYLGVACEGIEIGSVVCASFNAS